MIRGVHEIEQDRTRVSFDCDDKDLAPVLRAIHSPFQHCEITGLEVHPLREPAWNISFFYGPASGGVPRPLEVFQNLGLFKPDDTSRLVKR